LKWVHVSPYEGYLIFLFVECDHKDAKH
jgi:hypothetical protein